MMDLSPQTIFAVCFFYECLNRFFNVYLNFRQYKVHRASVDRPPHLAEFITEQDYKKARLYALDLHIFSFVRSLFNFCHGVLFLTLFSGRVWRWGLSGRVASYLWAGGGEISHSVAHILLMEVFNTLISLPFAYYRTFVISQRHGFNRRTRWFFLKDTLKGVAVSLAIDIPLGAAAINLAKSTLSMRCCFLYWWAFLLVVHLVMTTVYPTIIAPLFDNYAPLPDSDLKRKIEALAERVGFPLRKIYVVQNSQRSAHSNAYMYGFGSNKRIVLFDMLLSRESNELLKPVWDSFKPSADQDRLSEKKENGKTKGEEKGLADDEVLSVMGHELGHWKLWHTGLKLLLSEAYSLVSLAILSHLLRDSRLFSAFGFDPSTSPVLIGSVLCGYVTAPLGLLFHFGSLALSRKYEYDADRFTAELGYANEAISARVKLSKDNLAMPIDDWLYAMFRHSHPSGPERVEALRKHL